MSCTLLGTLLTICVCVCVCLFDSVSAATGSVQKTENGGDSSNVSVVTGAIISSTIPNDLFQPENKAKFKHFSTD